MSDHFPLLFWNYTSIASFPDPVALVRQWQGAGMTFAMSPNIDGTPGQVAQARALLDAAEGAQMQVVVRDDRFDWRRLTDRGEENYRQQISAAAAQLGAHPAVFGFHVGDEPGAPEFADACAAMRMCREVLPHKTPFLNLLPWHQGGLERVGATDWPSYLDSFITTAKADLLCYDCYAQMNPGREGWDLYFENLRFYADAARRHGIPYWTTLLSMGHFRYRCPSEDDFRWQLSTAVAHGARGILYFHFYTGTNDNYRLGPIDEFGDPTPTYDSLRRVNRRFTGKADGLFLQLTLERVEHVGEAFGGFPLFTGEGRVIEASSRHGTPLIISEFRHDNGDLYVLVTNNSCEESTAAEFWVRGTHPSLENVQWNGAHVPAAGDGWTQERQADRAGAAPWLAPGQMELYRVVDETDGA